MAKAFESVLNYGMIAGSTFNYSASGHILRSLASIEVDKARHQIKGLRSDKSRSPREKMELAQKGNGFLTGALTQQLNNALNSIEQAQATQRTLKDGVFKTGMDSSAAAIYAIELSKGGNATKYLHDKATLAVLASAPEAITGISPETLNGAKDAYIRKYHPEIHEQVEQTANDLKLVSSVAGINDAFSAEYGTFEAAEELSTGGASVYGSTPE